MFHEWYFKVDNPIFEFAGHKFSFEIFTDSNRYDLDEAACKVKTTENTFELDCDGLTWAGGQEKANGSLHALVKRINDRVTFDVVTKKDEEIRRVKVSLFDEELGTIIARRRYNYEMNSDGILLNYPNGWDDLFTPLVTTKSKNTTHFYRSLDTEVRPKHFFIRKEANGALVEMIFEEDTRKLSNELVVPTWEIGTCDSFETIFEEQRLYVEKAYKLVKWEDRKDVPDWMKKVSLVISLHGMHWSGHIFHTYKQMEEKLEWFSRLIDPHDVLVYIPGFDGRYYFKYPDYTPDERMGGKEGFKHLVDYAHKLGYHIMPMFMINGANPKTPGFETWGEPSRYHDVHNYARGVGSCDWDTSRGYNLACGIGLNPGAPLWQDYFVAEVKKQIKEFNFDALFLDLAAIYENDPRYSTHYGAKAIIDRIHEEYPNVLISTEGWYDALSVCFPFSQCAGEGSKGLEMIYQDTPYPKFFDEYNRMFGHLCLGDPMNGANGVFETGKNFAERTLPVRKGIIQTITVVDDSIYDCEDKVKEIIENAKKYKIQFLERRN